MARYLDKINLCLILKFLIGCFFLTLLSGCSKIDMNEILDEKTILSKVLLPKGTCAQLDYNLWAEHIYDSGTSSYVFDVYYNDSCSDSFGEYCDNVVPIDQSTGNVDPYNGSGTICWAQNLMISGILLTNDDIEVRIVQFK